MVEEIITLGIPPEQLPYTMVSFPFLVEQRICSYMEDASCDFVIIDDDGHDHNSQAQAGYHLTPAEFHAVLADPPQNLVLIDCRNEYGNFDTLVFFLSVCYWWWMFIIIIIIIVLLWFLMAL